MQSFIIELPTGLDGIINKVAWTLDQAKETQPDGVKIWLPPRIGVAYTKDNYGAGSPAGIALLDYRGLIETKRVRVYPDKKQVLLFISKDSLDAYFGKRGGKDES
jgi:hypothetical protein